tara:strand:- start:46 stop:450 length:405 start_codon:yes stop_codon:yes gene_type:complete
MLRQQAGMTNAESRRMEWPTPKRETEIMAKATLVGAALLALTSAPAFSASSTDVEGGRQIAMENCARCHAIAPGMVAGHPSAPDFVDIAGFYPPETIAEAFAEGVSVGHPDMPEFEFSVGEVEMLVRYLESLSP